MSRRGVTESVVEEAALAWLESIGWFGTSRCADMADVLSFGARTACRGSGVILLAMRSAPC